MSSTVVLHVWHYYSTYLLFFLLPTTTITTTTITTTTNTIIAYITQTQTNQKQHFSQCFTYTIVQIPCHLVILLLRECFSCFFFFPLHFHCCDCHCFTLHCQHCHWFGSCFVYIHKHLFDMQTNICSCLYCIFCFVFYYLDSNFMMEFDPIHDIIANNNLLTFVSGVACYVTFILCLSNSSVSRQRIASVFLSFLFCLYILLFFCSSVLLFFFGLTTTDWLFGTVRVLKRPDRHTYRDTRITMLVAWLLGCPMTTLLLLPIAPTQRAEQI